MNKINGIMVALTLLGKMVDVFGWIPKSSRSRTPKIGRNGGRRQRVHAPNDGRWHMKYHRSRV